MELPIGVDPRVVRTRRFAIIGLVTSLIGIVVLLVIVLNRPLQVSAEYSLTATAEDIGGLEPTSQFILTSSEAINPATVQEIIKSEPQLEFTITEKTPTTFELKPTQALTEDELYQIWIAKGEGADREHSWAFQTKAPLGITTSNPRDEATGVPLNSVIKLTFNRERIEQIEQHFTISPEISGRFESNFNEVTFIPSEEFEPETVYTVTIAAGLGTGDSDDTLAADAVIEFETASRDGSSQAGYLGFNVPFWDFRPSDPILFGIYGYQIPNNQLTANVRSFASRDAFVTAWQDSHPADTSWTAYHDQSFASVDDQPIAYSGTLTIEVPTSGSQFLRLPGNLAEGWYLLDVQNGNFHAQTWFQVTPVISYLNASGTKTAIWLKDQAGNAVANATIGINGDTKTQTDTQGVALIDSPTAKEDRFITVDTADHHLALPLADTYGAPASLTEPDTWWNAVTIDKTLYQPSDTLRFWAILKPRNGGELGHEPIEVRLTSTEFGSDTPIVYARTSVTSNDYGTVIGQLSWQSIPTGYPTLQFYRGDELIASKGVDVESFRKPAYRLTVEPDRLAVITGDKITLNISANFFDGTPVPNLKLSVKSDNGTPDSQEVTTDSNGQTQATVTAKTNPSSSSWSYLSLAVSSAVAEESDISSLAYILQFPSRYAFEDLTEYSGKTLAFRARLREVDLTQPIGTGYDAGQSLLGANLANQSVALTLSEVFYDKTEIGQRYDPISQTTTPIYQYSTRYEERERTTLTSGADGLVEFSYPLAADRQYRLTTQLTDPEGRSVTLERWAYGSATDRDASQATDISVQLIDPPEKSQYAPGESVIIELQDQAELALPPSDNAFLFLRMTDGIDSATVQSTSRYVDTFKESDIPNLHLLGVWWDGTRFREPFGGFLRRSQAVNISFLEESRRLNLDIIGQADQYRPGDNVDLTVRVTDQAGERRAAQVLAGAMDEAVFTLNPEESDPLTEFYADRSVNLVSRTSHLSAADSSAEGGGCFRAGTPILLADGTTKPIEQLRPGDQLRSRQPGPNGADTTVSVVGLRPYETFGGYLRINSALELTTNHKLLLNGEWALAGTAKIGDTLQTPTGSQLITSIDRVITNTTVYNIDVTEPNSYYAAGYLVHNALIAGAEKGAGSIRENFEDVATWQTVETGRDGEARIAFTLPDSLTAWRLMLAAVTKDSYIGKQVTSLPATLPFFVDATLSPTYLTADTIDLRLRAYGTGVTDAPITYQVASPALTAGSVSQTGGTTVTLPLGQLPVGTHTLEIRAEQAGQQDTIRRTVTVRPTYLTTPTTDYADATVGEVVAPTATDRVTVTLTTQSRARFIDDLQRLSYSQTYGLRLDSLLATTLASQELADQTRMTPPAFPDLSSYQTTGGLQLFPYSSADLTLSAMVAQLETLAANTIDRGALQDYFRGIVSSESTDLSQRARAVAGLAGLDQPVLPALHYLKDNDDLSLIDRAYIAFGLAQLGAKEEARAYFADVFSTYLSTTAPYIRITGLQSDDENRTVTALVAALAAKLDLPEADGLGEAALTQYPSETLSVLEQYLYLENVVTEATEDTGSISLTTPTGDVTHKFEDGPLVLSLPTQSNEPLFTITEVDGQIAYTLSYNQTSTTPLVTTDQKLGITRRYLVNNRETTTFAEGDLVKIELTPSIARGAISGGYTLVDFLPSGLRVTDSRPLTADERSSSSTNFYPPITSIGQQTYFTLYGSDKFYYYARVVSPGSYLADSPLLTADTATDARAVGTPQTITID